MVCLARAPVPADHQLLPSITSAELNKGSGRVKMAHMFGVAGDGFVQCFACSPGQYVLVAVEIALFFLPRARARARVASPVVPGTALLVVPVVAPGLRFVRHCVACTLADKSLQFNDRSRARPRGFRGIY